MSRSTTPNIGSALLRIHAVITRGLKVATEHSQSFAQQGCPDITRREGFIGYVRCFVSVLDAHHQLEDQMVFPYFRDKFPDAPYELLMTQHRSLVPILDQMKTVIGEAAAHTAGSEFFNKIYQQLRSIEELWHPHIRIEEDHFTVDRVGARIDPEEQLRMSGLFAEHGRQHTGPDFLVVPFLLYNLPPEERSILAAEMPPIVTEQLVPVVWKEKWEPMKPFLLP